ncbi:type II toxin-antitoxin system RelE family toxin [Streptomyces roseolus]|uniref:type II toxin-antitoxin system RelE family toxin n=1 Tax=Streptomyces roseolus TaxID=67358 RepID=UPI00365F64CF
MSPDHGGRRARVVFTPECDPYLEKLSPAEIVRLDRALVTISLDPLIGSARPTGPGQVPLREYTEGRARVIYHVSVLGTVVVVAYFEV